MRPTSASVHQPRLGRPLARSASTRMKASADADAEGGANQGPGRRASRLNADRRRAARCSARIRAICGQRGEGRRPSRPTTDWRSGRTPGWRQVKAASSRPPGAAALQPGRAGAFASRLVEEGPGGQQAGQGVGGQLGPADGPVVHGRSMEGVANGHHRPTARRTRRRRRSSPGVQPSLAHRGGFRAVAASSRAGARKLSSRSLSTGRPTGGDRPGPTRGSAQAPAVSRPWTTSRCR
jgi:hypothetical protein